MIGTAAGIFAVFIFALIVHLGNELRMYYFSHATATVRQLTVETVYGRHGEPHLKTLGELIFVREHRGKSYNCDEHVDFGKYPSRFETGQKLDVVPRIGTCWHPLVVAMVEAWERYLDIEDASMENPMWGNLIGGAAMWAIVLFLVFHRQRLLKKTRDWRPITGTVTAARARLLAGEASIFVDVAFLFGDTLIQVGNLQTDGVQTADYPDGGQVRLLVDPKDPRNCMLEKLIR